MPVELPCEVQHTPQVPDTNTAHTQHMASNNTWLVGNLEEKGVQQLQYMHAEQGGLSNVLLLRYATNEAAAPSSEDNNKSRSIHTGVPNAQTVGSTENSATNDAAAPSSRSKLGKV